METKAKLLADLRESRPDVAVSVSWDVDSYFHWDGDGPDPAEEGYLPHDVTVTATAIRDGKLAEGHSYLGGSYSEPGEYCPEIHGYFPQMLEEALQELGEALA